MYRSEVAEILDELIGEWTTVREELEYTVREKMEETGIEFSVEDFGECIAVDFEDDDGYDREVVVYYNLVGRNTWTINKVL